MINERLYTKGIDESAARSFFNTHGRKQRKIEKYFIPKIQKVIADQYRSFINAINTHGYHYAKANIITIVSVGEVIKVLKELYRKSAFIESNSVISYLKKPVRRKSFDFKRLGGGKRGASVGLTLEDLAPVIDQYFDIYLLKVSAIPITNTTRKFITDHLVREVDSGKDLQTAIEDFTELAITGGQSSSLLRASMIARSEATRSLSFGGLIGAYMSGVDVDKVWVTCEDERVRGFPNYYSPTPHTDLDLSEADIWGSFYNGEHIKFPGDPDASISNTINCRCAMFFKQKTDPEERPAPTLGNFLLDFNAGQYLDDHLNDITNGNIQGGN